MNKKYLNQDALTALKNYKYVSGQYSFMDHLLAPWWNYAVTLLPMWIAPNLVTLIGLGFMIVSLLQYVVYDFSMEMEFPPAFYLWSAFSIFIYQTLDAIDGK